MDILKAFNINGVDFEVNIQGNDDEPLFQANQIGKLLSIKNIRDTIRAFDADEKVVDTTYTLGGNQETTFLTETGLYRLLGMSRKPIARTFQKWVCQVVKEIRKTGEYKLKQQLDVDRKLIEQRSEQSVHESLLKAFDSQRIVYVCKLEVLDDNLFIIKVGHTNNIKQRAARLRTKYGMCVFLDVVSANKNILYEHDLHKHTFLRDYKCCDNINGVKPGRETYKVNKEQCVAIINYINTSVKDYVDISFDECVELEKLKIMRKEMDIKRNELQIEALKLKAESTTHQHTITTDPIQEPSEEPIEESSDDEVEYTLRARKHTRSPRIQQYDAETLQLVKTFDSVIEVLRTIPNSSASCLMMAAKKNTVYNGFRWLRLDRHQDVVHYDLPPTVKTVSSTHGLIAMIDINKTKIVEVFASQKDAAISRQHKSVAAICKAVKKGTVSSGHFWCHYDKCTDAMKEMYKSTNILPKQTPTVNSVQVQKICMQTNKVLRTYKSINDVVKKYQMSRTSLKRAHQEHTQHNGYYWNIVQSTT